MKDPHSFRLWRTLYPTAARTLQGALAPRIDPILRRTELRCTRTTVYVAPIERDASRIDLTTSPPPEPIHHDDPSPDGFLDPRRSEPK